MYLKRDSSASVSTFSLLTCFVFVCSVKSFKVSSFETRLQKEVDFRDGKIDPKHYTSDDEAFDSGVPRDQTRQPVFSQKPKNFQLMQGTDATFVCKIEGFPRPNVSGSDLTFSSTFQGSSVPHVHMMLF